MTIWTKIELLEALAEETIKYSLPDNLVIDEVVIDSRKTPKSGLFIAIHGDNNDGHNYLKQASDNGCSAFIIHSEDSIKTLQYPNFILVKNTFIALYKLAHYSRNRSKAKIIAITGSVGKTGTKEMLKLAFSTQGETFATAGNLNNHIGLPLSLCNFSSACKYGIFEMGMNHLGEIDPLSNLARPHLALITNIGPVHIENFKNEEEIAIAKSEIFSGLTGGGTALINADNTHFEFIKKRANYYKIKDQNIISFGEENSSDYQILSFEIKNSQMSEVRAKLKNGVEFSYQINSTNPAIIFNSIIVISCLDLLSANVSLGISTLKNLQISDGRGKTSEVIIDQKNITIIDDSYNASVLSMKAGLQHASYLKKALGKKRVVAALGDMLELGANSEELHGQIAKYIDKYKIDFTILTGLEMQKLAKNLNQNSYKTFLDSAAASIEIKDLLQDGDILYIKGSRGMKMEKIIENLTNKKSAH